MRFSNKFKNIIPALILSVVLLIMPSRIYADTTLSFWDNSYVSEAGVPFLVGAHFTTDVPIVRFEADVIYDSARITIEEGAVVEEKDKAHISKDAAGIQEGIIISCRTFVPGNTQLKLANIEAYTIANDVEERVALTANECVTDINITAVPECGLESIIIDGKALENFDANNGFYTIESDSANGKIDVAANAVHSSAGIEIINPELVEGNENYVIINVNNIDRNMQYIINVDRKETETTAFESVKEELTDSGEKDSVTIATASIDRTVITHVGSEFKYNKIFIILIVLDILTVIFLVYVVMRRRKIKSEAIEENRVIYLDSSRRIEDGVEYTYVDLTDRFGAGGLVQGVNVPEVLEKEIDEDGRSVISIRNVSMDFKCSEDEASSLKEHLIKTFKHKNKKTKRRVLSNVSFEINRGEVVGIIGTNGSGKSTILKIISGVLEPTEGRVDVDFDKIQLLTLGTGFDKELTGKENVYLNGAIIGYSKEFIDSKYDSIVEFAELQGFMNEKIKNYSSGMVSRLGFAIATARETPEILILDEVLSVGDMYFKNKSMKRVQEMIHSGSTVIIVSHQPRTIINNCTRAIWIEKGVVKADGRPKQVCRAYETMIKSREAN